MTRLLAILSLVAPLAFVGCGEEAHEEDDDTCSHPLRRHFFDGVELNAACQELALSIMFDDGTPKGQLGPGRLIDTYIGFTLHFPGWKPPERFPVLHYDTWDREVGAGVAIYDAWNESEPLRPTAGEGTLTIRDGVIVIEASGMVARRDGQERPYTMRLEGVPRVRCCEPFDCTEDEQAICAQVEALVEQGWGE